MRSFVTICLLGIGLVGVALAAPKKVVRVAQPPVPDAQQTAQKTMAQELRRGRQLAQQGQRAAAVTAFEAALRAVPDEPRVLSELGLTLREAGDLARAEQICKQAVQAAREPPLRAPALYNLGRVLEDKRDKAGAMSAYRESLRLRPNRIVRERLLDLDPTALSDAFQPEPLDGPYATIDKWCKKQDSGCRLNEEASVTATLAQPQAPWKEARVFTVGSLPEECVLAVRTSRGWFFGKPATCREDVFRRDVTAALAEKDVLAAPGPELLLTLQGTDAMKDYDENLGHSVCCLEVELSQLVICGIGPSQVPTCTPAINLMPPLDAGKGTVESGLRARYANDEIILERSDGKSIEDQKSRLAPTLRETAGRHRVVFP